VRRLVVLDATKRMTTQQVLEHRWLVEPTPRGGQRSMPISDDGRSILATMELGAGGAGGAGPQDARALKAKQRRIYRELLQLS